MAEEGVRTSAEERGEEMGTIGDSWVANGIDVVVQAVEPALGHAPPDLAAAEPELAHLLTRDDAELAPAQMSERPLTPMVFCTTIVRFTLGHPPTVAHAPPCGGNL